MVDGTTADARLERLLHIVPAAAREGGARLADLAAAFGATESRILEDIEELTARAYYHPGGWADDVQILVDADRVRVSHAAGLDRPLRLNVRETLCLALALRGAAASAHLGDGEARHTLLRRAEAHLGRSPAADIAAPLAVGEGDDDPEGIRATLFIATRERRPCALLYVKPGAADAEARVIHPYAMIQGEGAWYVVGHCITHDGIRVFRLDRILAAADGDGTFSVPDSFRPHDHVDGGRVYHADHEVTVRVRYAPRIARWIRERARWTTSPLSEEVDGSVVVEHRVADPHWVVEHALRYGADAEVLEPPEVRRLVLAVAEELVD